MKGTFKFIILILIAVFIVTRINGQASYSDYKTFSKKLSALAAEYPRLCEVRSIGKTAGGKDIWVLTIGTGEKENKPAVAVVGGVDASYLLGKELAAGFAENLLRDNEEPEVKALLGNITFYVIPDVSPDASDQNMLLPRLERNTNTRSTDDDRDFAYDEDPTEDLNKDGFITLMRVTDLAGSMIPSEEDARVMVQADLSKGQKGIYTVYSEGTDNDKDGLFNEDGPGGVNFNRNFTYNYEEYGVNSGFHAVSEPESKAVADFLYDHFNIYAVIAFGPQDNLGQPMKASERAGGQQSETQGQSMMPAASRSQFQPSGRQTGDRRITSIMRSDETINKLVSDKYHEITGLKGSPVAKTTPGNFMEWAYYHYGRYSFGTPGWWYPVERGKNPEASYLKYADDNKLENQFVEWSEISHPDFPGKKVEIGGIKPHLMINPRESMINELVSSHYKFITAVAAMHPELELIDIKTENVGDNIFRVTLKVHNKGIFATCAEVGNANQWTRIMRITFETSSGQSFLSGQKIQRMQRLEGDQSAEYSWLVSGKGSVKITAGALNTGTASASLELK